MSSLKRILEAAAAVAFAGAISIASAQVNNPGLFQSGAVTAGHLAAWGPGAGQLQDSGAVAPVPAALTSANDTNVTITLTGTPATALLQNVTATMGWTGTLAAARLNGNVVQSVVNDTNVTGSITAQALTLGWTGTLAAGRLNANVVQSITSADVTGSIAAQAATLTVAKFQGNVLPVAAGADSQVLVGSGASNFIFSTIPNCPTGVIQYTSATHIFSCGAAGTGTVTSVTCGTGLSGGTFTTTGTCALALTNAVLTGSPAAPTGTAAGPVMMGLGVTTCKITPTYSGRLLVSMLFTAANGTAAGSVNARLYIGSGVAPANGVAVTGTALSNQQSIQSATAAAGNEMNIMGIATGLTPGTAYWLDLSIQAGGGTANISSINCNAMEF